MRLFEFPDVIDSKRDSQGHFGAGGRRTRLISTPGREELIALDAIDRGAIALEVIRRVEVGAQVLGGTERLR